MQAPKVGDYEWMKTPAGKQPYLIQRPDAGVLAMAGIWECNRQLAADDQSIGSFTVLTTAANRTTGSIHDRMPVFLSPEDRVTWLDPNIDDLDVLARLLRPAAEDLLTVFPVSSIVNSPRNDVPNCVQQIELPDPPQQQTLF